MKVAIDLDGVIFNVHDLICRKAVEMGLPNARLLSPNEVAFYGLQESFGWDLEIEEQLWQGIANTRNWWMTAEPFITERGVEMLNQAIENHDVFFMTNRHPDRRPWRGLPIHEQTVLSLKGIGVHVDPYMVWCLDEAKGGPAKALGINLALDDNLENLDSFAEHGIIAVAKAWPYNERWPVRVPDVETFLEKYCLAV